MFVRNLAARLKWLGAPVLSFLAVNPLLAYTGPGADLVLTGYSKSLLILIAVAVAAVLLYPIYALCRFLFKASAEAPPTEEEAAPPDPNTVARPY